MRERLSNDYLGTKMNASESGIHFWKRVRQFSPDFHDAKLTQASSAVLFGKEMKSSSFTGRAGENSAQVSGVRKYAPTRKREKIHNKHSLS